MLGVTRVPRCQGPYKQMVNYFSQPEGKHYTYSTFYGVKQTFAFPLGVREKRFALTACVDTAPGDRDCTALRPPHNLSHSKSLPQPYWSSSSTLCLDIQWQNQTKNRNNPPAAPLDQLETFERLTKEREDATHCPDSQGHAHTACVLQDPFGRDEDAGSNNSANDDGDPPQQRDFLLQHNLLLLGWLPAVQRGQPAIRLPLQVAPIRRCRHSSFPDHAPVPPARRRQAQPKSLQQQLKAFSSLCSQLLKPLPLPVLICQAAPTRR